MQSFYRRGVTDVWRSGALYLLVSFIAYQGSVYLAQLIAARHLGVVDFGYIRILDAIIMLGLVPATAGIPSAIVTRVAASASFEDQRSVLLTGVTLSLGSGIVVAAAIAIIARYLGLDESIQQLLPFLVWVIPAAAVSRCIISYYQGHSRIRAVARFNVVIAFANIAAVATLVPVLGLRGWLIGRLASEIGFACFLVIRSRHDLVSAIVRHEAKRLVTFGIFAALAFAIDRIVFSGETLYLTYLLDDPGAVGIYGVAFLFYSPLLILPGAVNAAILPKLAQQQNAPREALAVMMRYSLFTSLLALFGTGILFAAAPTLITELVGQQYRSAASLVRIMLVGATLYVFVSGLGTWFYAMNRPQLSVIGNGIGAIVNIISNLFLIPLLGVTGAAIALVSTMAFRLLAFAALAYLRVLRPLDQENSSPNGSPARDNVKGMESLS